MRRASKRREMSEWFKETEDTGMIGMALKRYIDLHVLPLTEYWSFARMLLQMFSKGCAGECGRAFSSFKFLRLAPYGKPDFMLVLAGGVVRSS